VSERSLYSMRSLSWKHLVESRFVCTDVSVYCGRIGCGACSAAVLLPDNEEGDDFAIKN